jgi:2-isopropylmalate synthase
MGLKTSINREKLRDLTKISKFINERLLRKNNPSLPYVGESAFAHKGGLHASGVQKHSRTYEHIEPEIVGNKRSIIVSEQSGKSNLSMKLKELGFKVNKNKLDYLLRKLKRKEFEGYSYDGAEASFELFIMDELAKTQEYFKLRSFQVVNEFKELKDSLKRNNTAKANVVVKVKKEYISNSTGNGPVNALDNALRSVLIKSYPILKKMNLIDYKVRILTPDEGTKAITRVIIESSDENKNSWSTVGVSSNVINASYIALKDSITYKLIKAKIKSALK